MEDKKINERESIELISRMIRDTQTNTARHSAYPMLVWGYLTCIVSLFVWVGYTFIWENASWLNYCWLAIPLIGFPLSLSYLKKQKRIGASNYMERTIKCIWAVIGSCVFLLSILTILDLLLVNILLDVALLISIGSTLSGLTMWYKPIIITGILGIVLSFIFGIWVVLFSPYAILWFVIVFVVIMIIPGHILQAELKKNERA